MSSSSEQIRWVSPLIVAAALIALSCATSRRAESARVERLRVDLARDGRESLEALEGMAGAVAGRVVFARSVGHPVGTPDGVLLVPGVGPRSLHRWHADLAFAGEDP